MFVEDTRENRQIKKILSTMAIEDMYFSKDFIAEMIKVSKSFGTGIQRINMSYSSSAAKPTYSFSDNAIKVTLPTIVSGDELQGSEKAVYDCINLTGRSSSEIAGMVGYGKNKTLIVVAERKS